MWFLPLFYFLFHFFWSLSQSLKITYVSFMYTYRYILYGCVYICRYMFAYVIELCTMWDILVFSLELQVVLDAPNSQVSECFHSADENLKLDLFEKRSIPISLEGSAGILSVDILRTLFSVLSSVCFSLSKGKLFLLSLKRAYSWNTRAIVCVHSFLYMSLHSIFTISYL